MSVREPHGNSVDDVTIRRYRSADRDQIREIACQTASHRDAMESVFGDPAVMADLLTRYYTDFEPESLWVAEAGSVVIGYLSGCLRSVWRRRRMARTVFPQAVWRALRRGALGRRETWRLVQSILKTFGIGEGRRMKPILTRYPAHLHINLRPGGRGQGVGRALVERFEDQVREADVPGVHARVHAANDGARSFFESLGYRSVNRYPWYLAQNGQMIRQETIIYAKRLSESGPPSAPPS